MLRFVLVTLALLCSISALAVTIWIVLPAPIFNLFLVAVISSELSLWFGLVGLIGAGLGVGVLWVGHSWTGWTAISFGIAAFLLALVPPVEALRAAREHDVWLSLRQYALGLRDRPPAIQPQTATFATIDGQPLQLDAYLPTTGATHPAVILVHGGSWSGGRRSEVPLWNEWLAQHGYAVFDIEYRLTPQPNWQTATGDVKCAIGWVKRHAAQYNIDPNRIALMGRSAGGHLALLAAYTPDESNLPPSCDAPDSTVRAVIDLYGPTDLVWGYEHPTNPRLFDSSGILRRFLGGDPRTAPEPYRIAAPINHVGPTTPPTLMLHGGRDQLVSPVHMALLAERLRAANVPHRAVNIPYGQHGFDFHFNGWGSQIEQSLVLEFLQTYVAADER